MDGWTVTDIVGFTVKTKVQTEKKKKHIKFMKIWTFAYCITASKNNKLIAYKYVKASRSENILINKLYMERKNSPIVSVWNIELL